MLEIFKLIGLNDGTSKNKYLSDLIKRGYGSRRKKKADLSLEQEVSATSVLVGDEVTFTVTLNNDGPGKAQGVKVKDLLPEGFELTDFTTSLGSYNPHTGIWQVRKIPAHGHATLTLTATVVEAENVDDYTNVAEIIAARQFDPDSEVNNGDPTEDDYTSLSVSKIDLSLEKEFTNTQIVEGDFDGDGEIEQVRYALPGDEVSFEITVTNNGPNEVTGVKIFDDLTEQIPIGLEFLSFSNLDGGTSIDTDDNAQTIEVEFDTIAPGESKTITVNTQVSTENVTEVNLEGQLGITRIDGTLNEDLSEYYEVAVDGRYFLNLNVEKDAGESQADFGFLNFTNTAEIVSVNNENLDEGTITADAKLDISTYEITGNLNNNQDLLVLSIENPNNPGNLVSFSSDPNPDWEGGDSGYPYVNQSDFLPGGSIGTASLFGEWVKDDDPQYLADLDEWITNIEADGDLSNIEDEQELIAALVDFIESGIYSRDRFSQGSSTFINDQNELSTITFEVGEFSPGTANVATILVTDEGAILTDGTEQNQGLEPDTIPEEPTDLESLLESFTVNNIFTEPTALEISFQDSNNDGIITTQLQNLNGYNFDSNWFVKSFSLGSNLTEVIFDSDSSPVNIDLSTVDIIAGPETFSHFTIKGNHGKDNIVGSSLADTIRGKDGNDFLSGFHGNDLIFGGRGHDNLKGRRGHDTLDGGKDNDTLKGGRGNDTLNGGEGSDTFVFGGTFRNEELNITDNDTITDFEKDKDFIDLTAFSASLAISDLDSNSDGIVNAHDNIASFTNSNLLIDLTGFNGGTINLEGVDYVPVEAFIL